jgi:peptide chain release factor 1
MDIFKRFEHLDEKLMELEGQLSDPHVLEDQKKYASIAKEHAHVTQLNNLYNEYKNVQDEISDNKEILREDDDEEMREMAREEIVSLEERLEQLHVDLRLSLLPPDPNDDKNTILEVRAGTGGDEAALFVADVFKMYSRYADSQGWRVETLSSSPNGIGGFKEIIALISGDKVFSKLKHEAGAHRVQRVPETETQGRIHTSAITVAVLPEAEEVEVNIAPNDIKIDVYRASGPGGQSVNTTDSAVRITHLPTGLVVTSQDEKSQHKNKAKALQVLRARVLDKMQQDQHDIISADRRSQVGSGDRSERIRTYNYPQGRLTDHRINLTLYKLDDILTGKVELVIDPLIAFYQAEALKSV